MLKKFLIVFCLVSCGFNIYFLYHYLQVMPETEQAIQQQFDIKNAKLKSCQSILNTAFSNLSTTQITQYMQKQGINVINKGDDEIYVDNLRLQFDAQQKFSFVEIPSITREQ